MISIILFLSLVSVNIISQSFALDCFVCNNKAGNDDAQPCNDHRIESCSNSCSAVFYRTVDKVLHVRKFCTAPGTEIYKHVLLSQGSSLCQNVNTANMKQHDTEIRNDQPMKDGISAPAPPTTHLSTLICVCTTDKCNAGDYGSLISSLLLRNMEHNNSLKKHFPAPSKFNVIKDN